MNITIHHEGFPGQDSFLAAEKEGKRKSLQSNKNYSQRRLKYKSLFECCKSYQDKNITLSNITNEPNSGKYLFRENVYR